MVAEAFAVLLAVGACRSAVGEPFTIREAVFQLVTIVNLLLAAQNRHHFGVFDLPDAVEVVFYLFLFVKQLPLIVKVLPFAATAQSEVLAHWLHALVRLFFNVDNLTVEAIRFLLKYLNINDIAWCAEGDEHNFLFRLGDAHAFRTRVDNLDVLDKLWLLNLFHAAKIQKIVKKFKVYKVCKVKKFFIFLQDI